MRDLVIYHSPCSDGAWAAWAIAMGTNNWEGTTFHPAKYGDPPPSAEGYDRVFVVDFSYEAAVFAALLESCDEVHFIDHHGTAAGAAVEAKELGVQVLFDEEHSGAYLAWTALQPAPVPAPLLYVEDRDLWKWELEDSKEINTGLTLLGSTPEDIYASTAGRSYEEVIDAAYVAGCAMVSMQDDLVKLVASRAQVMSVRAGGKQYEGVPVCEAACLISEVGNALCDAHPDAPFALVWMYDAPYAKVSLRGRDKVNCAEVARAVGGGGHPNAAGLRTAMTPFAMGLVTCRLHLVKI